MASPTNLVIRKGSTFSRILRWESGPVVYKPITGIPKAAPTVVTCVDHDIPEGWRVAIVSVVGMRQINAQNDPPRSRDYFKAKVLTADTVQFDGINSAGFSAYKSGGYLRYNTPVPLTGYTARMSVKDRVGGTELLRLDTTAGGIVIDATGFKITLDVSAADTAALDWTYGVFDLEMVSSTGVVKTLLSGTVTVQPEVTTD
ncbi:hypothetical protein C7T35_01455 [Variovorax sp. WS11]|uniref:hypothetical protein n=1 Tax=Variovorax sp. WS11 TaxID=1105204 RepID=UPI000D0E33AE|nr:hypothetical protein [Variovorax sp. WS11]NDZ11481.1 hypothetical protein [Variovorax sp. WS11]PSL86661.1 hypothetical protein C7T35_01455 [Variovorax sp. WS11]